MRDKTENSTTYNIDDILDVSPVRKAEYLIWSEPEHEFTVRLRDGTSHDLRYKTRFEAYAVREALFGALKTVRGVHE